MYLFHCTGDHPEDIDPELFHPDDEGAHHAQPIFNSIGETNPVFIKDAGIPRIELSQLEHDASHRHDNLNGEQEYYKQLHHNSVIDKGHLIDESDVDRHKEKSIHRFDPELYAQLQYWPYKHIDGDARQLYYSQWLKHHPENYQSDKLTGEDIRDILVKKLHLQKRNNDRVTLNTDARKAVKLYSEFLKRNNLPTARLNSSIRQDSSSSNGQNPILWNQFFPFIDSPHNQKVDVLDTNQKLGKPKHDQKDNIHSDRNHHSADDERLDVGVTTGQKSIPIDLNEIQMLLDSGRHSQPYDVEMLGDISAFDQFDLVKRLQQDDERKPENSDEDSLHKNSYKPGKLAKINKENDSGTSNGESWR